MSETVIITRPEEDARGLVAVVEAAGRRALSVPLLSIRFRDDVDIPVSNWQAVAITSANGARALARMAWREDIMRARVFAVGAASGRAARGAGFADIVRARRGDVQGVIAAIRSHCDPRGGPILYPSGTITRGALWRRLEEDGFRVWRAVLYEAVAARRLRGDACDALRAERGWVVLYSPRTAEIWAKLVRRAGLGEVVREWRHGCLSTNVAEALAMHLPGVRDVRVAATPREEDMLRLLGLSAEDGEDA